MSSVLNSGETAKAFIQENFSSELEHLYEETKARAIEDAKKQVVKELKSEKDKLKQERLKIDSSQEELAKKSSEISALYEELSVTLKRLQFEVDEEVFALKTEAAGYLTTLFSGLLNNEKIMFELLTQYINAQLEKIDEPGLVLELSDKHKESLKAYSLASEFKDITFSTRVSPYCARINGRSFYIELMPGEVIRKVKCKLLEALQHGE